MKIVTKQVVLYSFFILLNSGPYNSFSSLLNYIHKSHGQGHNEHAQIFFVLNSIATISFGFILPNINIKSLKNFCYIIPVSFFIIYLLTYFGFLIGNSVVVFIFTLLQSVIAALGSLLIPVLSGRYINNVCQINKQQSSSGRYYGMFGSFMATSFLLGAILSGTSLQILDQKHDIYLILIFISIASILFLKFLVTDVNPQSQQNRQIIDQDQMVQNSSQNQKNQFFNKDCKFNKYCIFKNISFYRKMLPLYPYQILSGIIAGYNFHCAEDLVFSPEGQDKNNFLTLNLIFLGAGGIAGSHLCGYLSDKYKQKTIFMIGTYGYLLSFLMGVLSLQMQSIYISLLTGFISGATMLYGNNMLTIICSKVYGGKIQAFAANRFMINVSFILFNVFIGLVSTQSMHSSMYIEEIVFITLSIISLFMVRFVRQRIDANEQTQLQLKKTLQLNQVEIKADSATSSTKENHNNEPII